MYRAFLKGQDPKNMGGVTPQNPKVKGSSLGKSQDPKKKKKNVKNLSIEKNEKKKKNIAFPKGVIIQKA